MPRSPRFLLLIAFFALILFAAFKVWRVNAALDRALADMRALQAEFDVNPTVPAADLRATQKKLETTATDLKTLRDELGILVYFGPALSWLPEYGSDLAQAPMLLELSERGAASGAHTLAILNTLTVQIDEARAAGEPLGSAALDGIQPQSNEITAARAELAQFRSLRASLQVTPLSMRSRKLIERIDQLLPLWSTGLDGFDLAPALLGADRPRDYVVLVQNSDELRPSGGFISSVVKVRFDRGDISAIDFRDSYALDNPEIEHPSPPAALAKYMDAGAWYLRDANWSIDFPTVAGDVFTLYPSEAGTPPDGLIATNLNLVSKLLEATGPLEVDGETVDAKNAQDVLHAHYEPPQGQEQSGDWWLHRKDFAGKLLVTILQKLRGGDFDRFKLAQVLAQALATKDLLFYMNQSDIQQKILVAGWGGRLSETTGDALAVVDSNVGFNKVDPNIVRSGEYDIALDTAGRGHAQLTLTYQNLSPANNAPCEHAPIYLGTYEALQQGCYWDYNRVAGASDAELKQTTTGSDAGLEAIVRSRAVFYTYLVVPRGETKTITYTYDTPHAITGPNIYSLRVERQPGAPAREWHILITVPDRWANLKTDPQPRSINGHTLEYDLTPERDVEIVIRNENSSAGSLAVGVGLGGVALFTLGAWWLLRGRRGM